MWVDTCSIHKLNISYRFLYEKQIHQSELDGVINLRLLQHVRSCVVLILIHHKSTINIHFLFRIYATAEM